MRKKIVAGNWKMNLNSVDGVALVEDVLSQLPTDNSTHVIFSPSFAYLYKLFFDGKKPPGNMYF